MTSQVCGHCGSNLPEKAGFCPSCGTKLSESSIFCQECGGKLSVGQTVCTACGANQSSPKTKANVFAEPPSDEWEQHLADLYMSTLEVFVLDQQDKRQVDQYFQIFHESGFANDLQIRLQQMARTLSRDQRTELDEIHWSKIFDLVDFFLIRYCKDINSVYLPEAMLRYAPPDPDSTDLYRMAMDHLAFDHENVRVYTDFLIMPESTLRQAGKSYLFAGRDEKLWFICDQSLTGSGKTGFAMTNQALYWKAPTQQPAFFRYGEPLEVRFEKKWLEINGNFFDAGKALNVRLSKLLRRLQQVF